MEWTEFVCRKCHRLFQIMTSEARRYSRQKLSITCPYEDNIISVTGDEMYSIWEGEWKEKGLKK